MPGELVDVPDDRRGLGPQLGGEAVGVGLLDEIALVTALDLELVDLALDQVGDEDLPDPRRPAAPHRVPAAVPVVEVADDADPHGVRGPDGEVDAAEALVVAEVGPQAFEVAVVRPFAQQVKVEVGQDRSELVGVDELPAMPLVVLDRQAIREALRRLEEDGLEEAVVDGSAPSARGRPGSPCDRSTTHASRASGKNARTTQARESPVPTSCRPSSENGFQ